MQEWTDENICVWVHCATYSLSLPYLLPSRGAPPLLISLSLVLIHMHKPQPAPFLSLPVSISLARWMHSHPAGSLPPLSPLPPSSPRPSPGELLARPGGSPLALPVLLTATPRHRPPAWPAPPLGRRTPWTPRPGASSSGAALPGPRARRHPD